MAEKMSFYGRIFRRYIRPTKSGEKINIPVLAGKDPDSFFVNVIQTPGETLDLISALQDALESIKKGG